MNNTVCWVDIPVIDLKRAVDFYAAVLAQPVVIMSEGGFELGLLPYMPGNVSGCLAVIPGRQPSTQGPLVHINVEGRLDEATQIARENGATILQERQDMGQYGFRTIICDTEGNGIALYSTVA